MLHGEVSRVNLAAFSHISSVEHTALEQVQTVQGSGVDPEGGPAVPIHHGVPDGVHNLPSPATTHSPVVVVGAISARLVLAGKSDPTGGIERWPFRGCSYHQLRF